VLSPASHEEDATLAAQHSVVAHIAQPYAVALFELAAEQGQVGEVESDLAALQGLVNEGGDFARFLRSPVIVSEEKAQAMDAILSRANVAPTVGNFVKVVARNGRLFALPQIIVAFREMAAKARGEISAEVTSATALRPEQVANLADALKAKIGKTVTLSEHVDPSLIGGLIVKVGSRMIDSSLKTKLTAMRIAMKEVG
jgi:F-type H+-transporting ATPase subunit delta